MNIKIISDEKNWMESEAIHQLEKVAAYRGVTAAVAFPDLHPGRVPVGMAIAAEGIIYPHLIGNDIGCGMSFYRLGVEGRKISAEKAAQGLKNALAEENAAIAPDDLGTPYASALGTVGSGNHFAEMGEVFEIHDAALAERLGLSKREATLIVHSGSRGYGQHIYEKTLETPNIIAGFEEGTEPYTRYIEMLRDALQWSKKNRAFIAENFLKQGKIRAKAIKLCESVHNTISKDSVHGKTVHIHRKGASEAYDEPLIIPGSRDSLSYVVLPLPACEDTCFSVAHGAGRKWNRTFCKGRLDKKYTKSSCVTEKYRSRFVYPDREAIYEEAPEGYKDIAHVIEIMERHGLIRVIAAVKPLVTFKG